MCGQRADSAEEVKRHGRDADSYDAIVYFGELRRCISVRGEYLYNGNPMVSTSSITRELQLLSKSSKFA